MKFDLVLKNARLVDHAGEQFGAIAIQDGRIAAIGSTDAFDDAVRTVDVGGKVVMPGVIDPHCHLGVNYGYDDDMRTETAAAARGGVTTILLFIRNMEGSYIPFYKDRRERGESNAVIDFGFHFGIQREEHVGEIAEIARVTGVQSFKCHMGYEPGNPIGIVSSTDSWIFGAMREAAKLPNGVVSVHCENTELVQLLKKDMIATGRQDLAAYTESRPVFVEEEAIARMIRFSEITGCPLYIVHTTAAKGPVMASEARARGVDVTVETCPHYLTRTAYDPDLTATAKISPPLRDREQLEGLWKGVLGGGVGTLGTDHVPFEKNGGDLWKEKPGVVTFPWELSLMLHFGVHERGMSLSRLVELNSYNPAKRFGLYPQKGALAVGSDADLVVVDLDEERVVEHDGKGTCLYEGWNLRGWPVMTISRGEVIFDHAQDEEVPYGRGRCVTVPESERALVAL
ncbi:dihydroorotase [Arthrobacter sp. 35W]|uniref:dihydroorotase n=1 Tax=Arthrobacter sp. 35W TaxID=1132441 RepID=UPI00040793EF|nr:amidohydrolase family protein [Arthrobacter sp. 35W]